MAYGIQITAGTNNDIIISDSEKQFLAFYPLTIGSGTKTAQAFDQTTDLIFIKSSGQSSGSQGLSVTFLHFNASSNNSHDNKVYFVAQGNSTTLRTVNYVHLRIIDTATPTGDYGLQIFNSQQDVQFDSRVQTTQNNSIFIDTIFGAGDVDTGFSTDSSAPTVGPLTSYYSGIMYNSSSSSSSLSHNLHVRNEYLVFNSNASYYAGVGVYQTSSSPGLFGGNPTYYANSVPIVRAKLII